MTKTLNEAQFRGLVRKLVHEYASDDQNQREPNFNKQSHADPSARNWDNGLDEEDDSSDLSQGGPDAGDEETGEAGHSQKHRDTIQNTYAISDDEWDGLPTSVIEALYDLATYLQ